MMSINANDLKIIIKRHNEQIEIEKIEDDKLSITDQGFDSLDIIDVLLCIEEEFNLKIEDEVASTLISINDYVNYINLHKE
ncbi:MAG: phosphopantetheine-binding protein [Melioribacteraceae bacterium]|nr:phosphopantetheine-binding protein [Melioribacteraceae bacterium]